MKTASTEREAIVAEVAAKLTAAQRRSVLDGLGALIISADLDRLGLLEWRQLDWPYTFGLNSFGLAVRDHLKDQDHGRA